MKKNILVFGILLISNSSFSQDAKEILQKCYDKCQSVKNGSYEMTEYMKYMSGKDTTVSSFNCTFKKLKDDSLYSSAFHYTSEKTFEGKKYPREVMYTGDDFVNLSSKDSTATITSKLLWAEDIKRFRHNYTFYTPLTDNKSKPILHDSDFIDKKYSFKFINEEKINDIICYHILENSEPENDSTEPMKMFRIEYHYWINKKDFIPVQFSEEFGMVLNNDSMYQFKKFV